MRRVRHKKRGSTYEVLGEAEVQIAVPQPINDEIIGQTRIVAEGDKLVVYRSEKDGNLWVRFPDEFEDGRFEDIT